MTVAFRSAKVAAFAERKATNPEVILRPILSSEFRPHHRREAAGADGLYTAGRPML